MALNDFYKGTTKDFDVTIYENNVLPDITNDIVKISFKESLLDDTVALEVTASVAQSGSVGQAFFTLTPTQTTIDEGTYYYEIAWITSGSIEEYVLEQAQVSILTRVNE